ncbi:hypothetical protein HRG69_12460 [Enterococcus faecalis]|uniref:hypothetical protein n=1 Tax=Bacteria TaxID=2 RepID=UPI000FD7FAAB|nr:MULTISPECIES: hypothetical protein [Bacteria]EGO7897048.1 hypothetical protein [Enterococcus faecalis]EGO8154396.1 hypothetical protein [Enterococcus faecalis]EIY8110463.1 hypothetical protein [Enterococcus faecalis]EJJ1066803.1 hypothetical protein [Enterococcus faecalis]EKZ0209560.1 hypothetical protein [Enterococcus faecalis]
MGEIKFERISSGIESVTFSLVEIEENIALKGNFKIEVNKENSELLRLVARIELYKDKSDDCFMKLEYYGIYKTDNQDPDLVLKDVENASDLLRDILPAVNNVMTVITTEGLGAPIELPEAISEIDKEF